MDNLSRIKSLDIMIKGWKDGSAHDEFVQQKFIAEHSNWESKLIRFI
jgi:hypothetical protein